MQKSAEYRLLTQQTYRYALVQLINGLQNPDWTADEDQFDAADFRDKIPAVILDLDETVLDNSAFNARNILEGTSFTVESWNQWCLEGKAKAIPGALEFVKAAEGLGVVIFYITNREDEVKEATVINLRELRFPVTEENLLTMNESEGRGDDKISRKAMIAENHRILLLIGDSAGDLCNDMDQSDYRTRNQIAAQKAEILGARWIVLPNPVYGGWQRALPKGAPALETSLD